MNFRRCNHCQQDFKTNNKWFTVCDDCKKESRRKATEKMKQTLKRKSENRKGMSPLVATVLIVGSVIVLAAIIIYFGQTIT